MKKVKREKGITLIALIVTIIVLLILAGIAVNLTVGNNGIFKRAEEATIKHENGAVYEDLMLQKQGYQFDMLSEGVESSFYNKFKNENYIDEDGIVNMTKVLNGKTKTGKGSKETGDIYVIKQEEEGGEYYLYYYNDKKEETKIGAIFESGKVEKTLVDMFKKAQTDNCVDGKTCTKLEEHVHVGDYVINYNSTLKNSTASAELLPEETGMEELSQRYNVETTTTWRVAGLSKDEKQLIITTGSPIKKQMEESSGNELLKDPYLYLKGAEGWYHTNDELTNENILDRASKIYDSRYASKVQSMRIEDIETLLGLSIEEEGENTKAYKTVNGTKTELGEGTNIHFFGQSHIYENEDYAPENYLKEKYPSNPKYARLPTREAGNSVPGSAYAYMITNPDVVDQTSKIYEILFKDTTEDPYSKSYWLASSGVGIGQCYAYFSPGDVNGGRAARGGDGLFDSYGGAVRVGFAVRPIVYLESNVTKSQLVISGNGEEEEWTTEVGNIEGTSIEAGQIGR